MSGNLLFITWKNQGKMMEIHFPNFDHGFPIPKYDCSLYFSMRKHRLFPWKPCIIHGSMGYFHGKPWFLSMENHGFFPWKSMMPFNKHGKPWFLSMENHGFFPWKTMVSFHGKPWFLSMENHGFFPWKTMVSFHGKPWFLSMENHGFFPWKTMVFSMEIHDAI